MEIWGLYFPSGEENPRRVGVPQGVSGVGGVVISGERSAEGVLTIKWLLVPMITSLTNDYVT